MGSESQGSEEAHLYESKEEMESLLIDDTQPNGISSNYRSAMSSLSGTHHPLFPPIIATPADNDPLLSPPLVGDLQDPDSPDDSYIEPPSYADVILSPLNSDKGSDVNGAEIPSQDSQHSMTFSICSSSSSGYLKITVSNPQKEQEASNSIVPGGNTYVTYLITTRTNIAEFGGSEFSVRRRFKDVVTLADRLSESYRGFFVPPRPDKSVVESQVMQKQEFVEQRRVALEKYLSRLAAHPVIKKSDELRIFLKIQGKLPLPATTDTKLPKQWFGDSASMVERQEVVQPAKGGRDFMRLFKELKQSMAYDWGAAKPPLVEEDKEFLERKEKLHDLEQQISNASKQVIYLLLSMFRSFLTFISRSFLVPLICQKLTILLHSG